MSSRGRTRSSRRRSGEQPLGAPVHWGEVKLDGQRQFLAGARMVVPRLRAGDIIVAHSFLAHGTSANTSDVRRDMIFQRRAAIALCDPLTRAQAREAFMRDPWTFFRLPARHVPLPLGGEEHERGATLT